jgi:DNA-binding NarL/FixJ family response regulator
LGAWSPSDELPSGADLEACVFVADSAAVRNTGLVPRLTSRAPRAKVVAFAVAEENEAEIIACARAGVAGFVARDASVEELVDAIRSAAGGGARCSPRVTAVVLGQLARSAAPHAAMQEGVLTPRENEILGLIDAGYSNKRIARTLGLEISTIKNHVHNILEKLRVAHRGEAAAFVRARRHPAAGSLQV